MVLDSFKLDGKVAIVTGAKGGLGQGMAIALAEAGADIAGVDRNEMTETENLIKKTGKRFLGIKADLSDIKTIDVIMEEVLKNFNKVHILVNCAGIIRRDDSLDFSEKDWDDVIDINLKAVFFFSQAVARQYKKQETGGKIINIASMLSFQGGIRIPSYTASKSGVMGITRLMANEWAKLDININAIAPGYMTTDNTKALREDVKRYNEIIERIPAGRWGIPDDLKGIVVFLASDASKYVNGFTVAVDGGWLAR
jgi:2-deoxy-D-gluconate 3-dehydrogenase